MIIAKAITAESTMRVRSFMPSLRATLSPRQVSIDVGHN